MLALQLDETSRSQRLQRRRRRARIQTEVLGDQPRRRARRETAVDHDGTQRDLLEHDPHHWTQRPSQLPSGVIHDEHRDGDGTATGGRPFGWLGRTITTGTPHHHEPSRRRLQSQRTPRYASSSSRGTRSW